MYTPLYAPCWIPCWIPMVPLKPRPDTDLTESPPKTKPEQSSTGYRIRVGKWEEVYDTVDGTKTWYNTVTEKTTRKDPFF